MSAKSRFLLFTFLLLVFAGTRASAQTSTFTYQGRLTDGGTAANGTYQMQFSLFRSLGGNDQIGATLTFDGVGSNPAPVQVANGVFTVELNFTVQAFDGSARWLQIAVKKPTDSSFVNLDPRQALTSTPYAIRSLNAASADTLGGVAAGQYVVTTDPRMTDARTPTAGSGNYIQNTSSEQANSRFNISGNGRVGGSLGIGTNGQPDFKLEVIDSSNAGLRVQTNATGGKVASFGSNGAFQIDASLTEGGRFVVTESGNVGIAAETPNARLQIGDNGGNILFGNGGCGPGYAALGFAATLTCSNYSLLGNGTDTIINRPAGGAIAFRENNQDQMLIAAGGVVSLTTLGSAGSNHLCINNSNQISNCSSSLRYKTNINPFSSGLNLVKSLTPITFSWKDGGIRDLGLGAEDVAKLEPLLITRNQKGEIEGVKYDRIAVVLINAVNEQQQEIEQLKAEVRRLNSASHRWRRRR